MRSPPSRRRDSDGSTPDHDGAQAASTSPIERLQFLGEVSAYLLSTDDPDALVRGLFERLRGALAIDALWLHRSPEPGGELRLDQSGGLEEGQMRGKAAAMSLAGWTARLRKPIVADHLQDSMDPMLAGEKSLGFTAVLGLPLLVGGRLVGTLCFASRTRRRFDPADVGFLTTVSSCSIAALERARLARGLQEAEQRKDLFLATLAHELRNPLAPIRNALEVLRLDGSRHDTLEGARALMERQVSQMVRLIDDLLDLSRITRGRVELRREASDLARIVESAVETCRPLAAQWGHRVSIDLPANPLPLYVDPTRLSQVFANLLGNACRYTPPGGDLRIVGRADGDRVTVVIEDNGMGIEAARLPGIFEPFGSARSRLDLTGGGLGIGLFLVQALVELHGGTVTAESGGENRGSRFTVRLPMACMPLPQPDRGADELEGWMKRRIVVADDNRDSVESMALLLGMLGHEVRTAADGIEAVEAAREFRPDVVFLDIGMPRMNGYEAAVRIRALPGGGDIRLIAITGWGQDDDRRSAQDAGFDHHVTKPVDPQSLRTLLASAPPRPE